VDVEPLRLEASEAAGDGLKRLADLIEMVQSFPQTEVGEVVGAEFVAQERRELLILFQDGVFEVGANEPGSSIMPGKVNPTQCEALTMIALAGLSFEVYAQIGLVALIAVAKGWPICPRGALLKSCQLPIGHFRVPNLLGAVTNGSARDQRLGGRASRIDAGAAEEVSFTWQHISRAVRVITPSIIELTEFRMSPRQV
jgi:hypothetical protein